MIYKLDNHAESVLDLDNDVIYDYILNKLEITNASDEDVIEKFKVVTRDPCILHDIAVETKVPIYDILIIIVKKRPDLVDKRFLTRTRKLFNTKK